LTLTEAELADLTHKVRPSAQTRALRGMGIEHRRRPGRSVAVLRIALEDAFGIKLSRVPPKRFGINWEGTPNARPEPDWITLLKADEQRLREKRKKTKR